MNSAGKPVTRGKDTEEIGVQGTANNQKAKSN